MTLPHHHQGFLQTPQATLSLSLAFFYVLKRMQRKILELHNNGGFGMCKKNQQL